LENGGRVRLGMDDFSQKVLGPGDEIRLPLSGMANLAAWDAAAALLFSYKLVLLLPEDEQALPASVGQFAELSIAGAGEIP